MSLPYGYEWLTFYDIAQHFSKSIEWQSYWPQMLVGQSLLLNPCYSANCSGVCIYMLKNQV